VLTETNPAAAVAATPPAPAADPGPGPRKVVILPAKGWSAVELRELWRYRELLLILALRDIKVRYKQTALGVAWAVLQPALMMVVFTIFFGRLAGISTGGVPQPLFFLTGVLPWFFFASTVNATSNSILGAERLISKVYFPRLAVPFATALAAGMDFLIACGLLGVVMLGYGVAPGWNLLFVPVVVGIIALLATGLGTLLAALNVAFRDFRYAIPFLMQLGMFATPTIYSRPTGAEGEVVRWLLVVNPMTPLVEGFRACAIGGPIPWAGVLVSLAAAVVVFLVGCLYFRKVEDSFADVI
jgi:lipopolysaccharide transport system permease protein